MKLRDYICDLDAEALKTYAERSGISFSYLRLHVKYASKNPSVSLIRALARESNGNVSLGEVLDHYGITDAESTNEVA